MFHLSRYVASHPGQLSLAIPSWVGAVSTIALEALSVHAVKMVQRIRVEVVYGHGQWGAIIHGRTVSDYVNEVNVVMAWRSG